MNENILSTFKSVYVLNRIFGVIPYKLGTFKDAFVFNNLLLYFIRLTFYLIVYGICAYKTKNVLVQSSENIPNTLSVLSNCIMGTISIINFINNNLIYKKITELFKILTSITDILQNNQIKLRHKKVQIYLIVYIIIKIIKLSILETMNFIQIILNFKEHSMMIIIATIYSISTLIDLCVESQLLFFLYYSREIYQTIYLYLTQKHLKRSENLTQALNDINKIYRSSVDLLRTVNKFYSMYILLKCFNTLTTMVTTAFLTRKIFYFIFEYTEITVAIFLWLYISIYGTCVLCYMFEMTSFEVSKLFLVFLKFFLRQGIIKLCIN